MTNKNFPHVRNTMANRPVGSTVCYALYMRAKWTEDMRAEETHPLLRTMAREIAEAWHGNVILQVRKADNGN